MTANHTPEEVTAQLTELADGEGGPLMQQAIMHHELYVSYIKAGFTEPRAFELTKALVLMIEGNRL